MQTTHVHDALGRLVQRTATHAASTDPNLKAIRDNWFWDPVGGTGGYGLLDYAQRLRGTSVGTLSQIWRQTDRYEANTKRLSSRTIAQSGQSDWLTQYAYDTLGHESVVTYPSTLPLKKTYTDWGELRQLSNNATAQVYWTVTAKDAWGNVTAENWLGGLAGTHDTYASTGQVESQYWFKGSNTIDEAEYAYDSFGNLAEQTRRALFHEAFTYDSLQRLTQTTRTGMPETPLVVTYAYLISVEPQPRKLVSARSSGSGEGLQRIMA